MTRVVLRRNPDGMPVPDDFELQEQPMPEAAEGEVLVRTIYLSLDPYMRGGMSRPDAARPHPARRHRRPGDRLPR